MVNINDRRLGLPILYFAAVTYRESYYQIPTELPQWQVLGAKTFLFFVFSGEKDWEVLPANVISVHFYGTFIGEYSHC